MRKQRLTVERKARLRTLFHILATVAELLHFRRAGRRSPGSIPISHCSYAIIRNGMRAACAVTGNRGLIAIAILLRFREFK